MAQTSLTSQFVLFYLWPKRHWLHNWFYFPFGLNGIGFTIVFFLQLVQKPLTSQLFSVSPLTRLFVSIAQLRVPVGCFWLTSAQQKERQKTFFCVGQTQNCWVCPEKKKQGCFPAFFFLLFGWPNLQHSICSKKKTRLLLKFFFLLFSLTKLKTLVCSQKKRTKLLLCFFFSVIYCHVF